MVQIQVLLGALSLMMLAGADHELLGIASQSSAASRTKASASQPGLLWYQTLQWKVARQCGWKQAIWDLSETADCPQKTTAHSYELVGH